MTIVLSGTEVAVTLEEQFTGVVTESTAESLELKSESLPAIAFFLKTTPGFDFDYLASITAVDYGDYFGLVYRLVSIKHNHSLEIKVQCSKVDMPAVPSVVSLWQGADFQEREIYDLMGICFNGHPNMKRLSLWDGFQGHPLRKDYVNDA